MNNRLSYCGLVEARISAFDKDLPVHKKFKKLQIQKCEIIQINVIKFHYGSILISRVTIEFFDYFRPDKRIGGEI